MIINAMANGSTGCHMSEIACLLHARNVINLVD